MKKRNLTSLFLLMLTCFLSVGQIKIKGKVFDDKQEGVIGVTVREKDSKSGTVTDNDGNFTLTVSGPKAVLNISYIGMKNQTVVVGNKTDFKIELESNSVELNEVVAIGYGSARRSDLTGSVSSIKVKNVETTPVVSVDQILKGKSSGVYVNSSSAEPGGVSTVKIRGVNSLTGDTEPLYVVDGVAMDNVGGGNNPFSAGSPQQKTNPLTYLSPQDIVNIEVLKDASATAIFGARGTNGVVLITTKSGTDGAVKVNVTSSMTVAQPRKKINVLNGPDYARYRNEIALLQGTPILYGLTDATRPENIPWVNWQDEVLRTSVSKNLRASVSGGSKSSNYYLSSGYDTNEGLMKNTAFDRADVRFNFNSDLSKSVKLNFNVSGAMINSQMTQTSGAGGSLNSSAIRSMVSKNPIIGYQPSGDVNTDTPLNSPTAWVSDYTDDNTEANINAKLGLTFKINKIFSYEVRGSYNFKQSERWRYYGRMLSDYASGAAGVSTVRYGGFNIDNLLNYDYAINKTNRLSGVIGFIYNGSDRVNLGYMASGFGSDRLKYEQIESANNITKLTRDRVPGKGNSYLGRINYSLMNRYLLTVSGRIDGSSKLAINHKYSFFPSVALAWRIKEEPFLKNVDKISNLKLRLGWGGTGNSSLPPNQSLTSYTNFGFSSYSYGGQYQSGQYIGTLGNQNLKWETSGQFNLGVDLGLFDERLSMNIDVYSKKNYEMLINAPLIPSTGYASNWVNQGAVINNGIDVSANVVVIDTKKFKWNVDANVSLYRNKIADLNLEPKNGMVSFPGGIVHPIGDLNVPATMFIEGRPTSVFWGYKTAGVYQTQEQINQFVKDYAARKGVAENPNFYLGGVAPKPGQIIYVDANDDGKISTDDYTEIGNPNPDFTWGLNSNMTYGNWGFAFSIVGVQGKDVLNANLNVEDRMDGGIYNISKEAWNGRWRGAGSSNYFPAPGAYLGLRKSDISDRLVEDASYIRLSNVTLSYTTKFKKLFVRDLKVFVTGNNWLTITKYRGYDPEVDSFVGDPLRANIDNNSYPSSKSIILGLNVNF